MRQTISARIAWQLLAATLLVSIGILAIAYVQGRHLDVIYVPTPRDTVERMLQIAEVGPDDFVIDLGSGDGRIPIAAARRGARALGVDLDPARVRDSELNAARAGVSDRATFRQQNLFDTDLSQATVLTLYLLPILNMKLRPKILGLRPGTRVVSHDFGMGDWKPDLFEAADSRIHFWVVPAPVAGRWQLRSGNRSLTLLIEQMFQQFHGTATEGGRSAPLQNTKLRGSAIDFTFHLEGRTETWRGNIEGDQLRGSTDAGVEWTATR